MYAVPLTRNFQPIFFGWRLRRADDPELGPHGTEYVQGYCFYGRHFLRYEVPFARPAILCQPYTRSRFGYYSPPLADAPTLLAPASLHEAVYERYGAPCRFPELQECG